MDRRDFIKMLGLAGASTAAYAASTYMSEALAQSTIVDDMLNATPQGQNGSLKDIEHVIFFMQENRSFDHYYGTLRGVRGFGDPRPLKTKDGSSVWNQKESVLTTYKPYHLNDGGSTQAGEIYLIDPLHDYGTGRGACNNGWHDRWMPNKGLVSLAHYAEKDIPLYFKLAKSFTIGDAYFCSHNGATDTNRSYFWSGTSNGWLNNALFSGGQGPRPNWLTYPERLEKLGVDWKIYQDGLDWTSDPFAGNYGDNILQYFEQYDGKIPSDKKLAAKKRALYEKARALNTVLRTGPEKSRFEQDVIDNKLPAVSWIVAPEAYSEHPKYPPHFGEFYLQEVLRALVANPEVWHKTALIINYDENCGFFDHVPPPVPPLRHSSGMESGGINLPVARLKDGTRNFDMEFPEKPENDVSLEIGMGVRVPLLIISPWTVGGRVCSEVFDHTSCLRFLDRWPDAKGLMGDEVPFPNISSWRRAIAGDLTSAFDFNRADTAAALAVMDNVSVKKTAAILTEGEKGAAKGRLPLIPTYLTSWPDAKETTLSKQDRTRCEIMPLGYDFKVIPHYMDMVGGFQLTFKNLGKIGASFRVYSYHRTDDPCVYPLAPVGADGKVREVTATYTFTQENRKPFIEQDFYDIAVHGPNGFLGEFRGNGRNGAEVSLPGIADIVPVKDGQQIQFIFDGPTSVNFSFTVINAYTGETKVLPAGISSWACATVDGWYDVAFLHAGRESSFLRRFAGHLENGRISKSDPAIGKRYDSVKRTYSAEIV